MLKGTGIGDEGGFAPPVDNIKDALDLLVEAVDKAGHKDKVHFAIDPASSEFFKDGKYDLDFKSTDSNHKIMSPNEMAKVYADLLEEYPIMLLEDPFAEDDWESWTAFMKMIKGKVEVVGDDLLCTQVKRVERAREQAACDGLLLKVRECSRSTPASLCSSQSADQSSRHHHGGY